MIKSLRQARITDGLPRVLARQEWVIALSEALGLALGKTLDYTDESQIYTRLDTAPETVLDVLAVDWKIDWYDTELTVEQKRRIVKTALTVRRLMGTAAAVKLQVHAIYPEATVRREAGLLPGEPAAAEGRHHGGGIPAVQDRHPDHEERAQPPGHDRHSA